MNREFIKETKVKYYFHERGKRITREALERLDRHVGDLLDHAIKNSAHHQTIRGFEMFFGSSCP